MLSAKADRVQAEITAIEGSGLRLSAVDILELSLRNIAAEAC